MDINAGGFERSREQANIATGKVIICGRCHLGAIHVQGQLVADAVCADAVGGRFLIASDCVIFSPEIISLSLSFILAIPM